MKSNEEFIAGIYEKAASYTEEKETKIIRVNFVAKATKIAAMFAVCLGLAGVGMMTLGGQGKTPQGGNDGIALLSEDREQTPDQIPEPRILPELSYLDGEVEEMDAEHGIVIIRLRDMTKEESYVEERALATVCFDLKEGQTELFDKLNIGMQIKVGGTTVSKQAGTTYGLSEASATVVLLVTRRQDFYVWSEESEKYIRPDFVSGEDE